MTGTEIYRPQDSSFHFQRGPLFHNLILADEINRAPAKVQSALLEAMAEHQITVGRETYPLPALFMVMATQNPIEQEGTYPLPEAQLDRFLLHIKVDYPDADCEQSILQLTRKEALTQQQQNTNQTSLDTTPQMEKITQKDIFDARRQILQMYMSEEVERYLIALILGTRQANKLDSDLARWIDYGASPRATIALDRCARAHAWLQGKDFVAPSDIAAVAHEVLRHRILLTFEAEANGITTDKCISRLLSLTAIP